MKEKTFLLLCAVKILNESTLQLLTTNLEIRSETKFGRCWLSGGCRGEYLGKEICYAARSRVVWIDLGKVNDRQSLEGSVCSGALLCCSVAGGHQDHRQVAAGLGESAEGVPRGGHHETAGPPAHHQAVPGQAQLLSER